MTSVTDQVLYLTVKEYADLIRVHPMTIYVRIREHRQPGVRRFGRAIRIDVAEAVKTASTAPSTRQRTVAPAFGGLFANA